MCARVCVGVRMQGKKGKRREEGKNKQPNSKDMWFSSCGLMQGLCGLSEDRSPECGRAKDWVGLGRVLRTKSLLRKLCPGRGRQQEGRHVLSLSQVESGTGLDPVSACEALGQAGINPEGE